MTAPGTLRTVAHALQHNHPDASLWAAAARLEAADAALDKAIEEDEKTPHDPKTRTAIRQALAEGREALAAISVLQGHTVVGCMIKASIMSDDWVCGGGEVVRAIAASLVADLARLAART